MLKWFAKKRFSHVDGFGIVTMVVSLERGAPIWVTLVIMVGFAAASATVERIAGVK